jgi:TPP-dependent pyruvate/acetoin dehydrogenase alpha subunit
MALAEKRQGSGAITVVFMGDGTLGEGVVYESLNMASLWGAPILFVLENNHIAQTTPTELALAGSMTARFEAFGIPTHHLDSSDILEIRQVTEPLVTEVRQASQPRALVIDTVRFGAHSKGDDTRSELEMAALRAQRDPLKIHGARLSADVRYAIDLETYKDIDNAFQTAMQSP